MKIKTPLLTIAKEEISVIDEEKIKNRKCYLVEYRRIDKNNNVIRTYAVHIVKKLKNQKFVLLLRKS